MFGRETRMLLRHYLDQGSSKSALARQLGVSRDTIHRWIRDGDLDRDVDDEAVRYGPRPAVPTKLDPYKAIIETRLAAYPELSSVRLLEEIRAAGYSGGYTQLKAFVHRVLEHYSHIRIDAKRQALDALDAARRNSAPHRGEDGSKHNGEAPDEGDIDALVEVPDEFTSQSRHSLRLSGVPPSGKLLIPLERRDVRVVEGARLESVCRGNSTVGSNPTLSASSHPSSTMLETFRACSPSGYSGRLHPHRRATRD
jgi:transposase